MEQLLNLRHLLQHEIEDLDSAEDQIIEALPQMVEFATAVELKKALTEHLKVTREHKKRIERIQHILNKDKNEDEEKNRSFFDRIFGGSKKCKGMEGLITEGKKMMSEDMEPTVRDAAIIASCQKIEHYEISGYGTARAYANQLNLVEVERLLQTTLNEEYKADDSLTVLALKKINLQAEGLNGHPKNIRKGKTAGAAAKKSAPVKKTTKKTAESKVSQKSVKKKSATR